MKHNILLFLILSLFAFGQKNTKITISHVPSLPPLKGELMVGASMKDITPPPGLPIAGRSLSGKKNVKGFRTRLKTRICYLRDKEGTSVLLIQLDLIFASLNMHHFIAEQIAKKTDVPISNIVLACTHTHSGPGNFFSNDFHNKFTSPIPGFDNELYKFINDQILSGIEDAYKNLYPAKIATGRVEFYGATKNRALGSFIRNKGLENLDIKNDTTLIYRAINPYMYMLRVDAKDKKSGKYYPFYAFTIFSSHGTALPDAVDVFNADTFAYAQRDLPNLIKKEYTPEWDFIHAYSNGTEGDMAPNIALYKKSRKETPILPLDWVEVKRHGKTATDASWKLFKSLDSKLKSDIVIRTAAKEINISKNNTIDGISICKKAAVGSALFGGAYENRTPYIRHIFPAASFMTRAWFYSKNSCNGNRQIGLGILQRIVAPRKNFPTDVMFQLIQIDDFLLVPLPFEITITTGKRIQDDIKYAYNSNKLTPPKYIVVTSASNDYMGYATTPEEYSNQEYEGGHTIYGKNTAPYIAAQLYRLSDSLLNSKSNISDFPSSWSYDLKTKNRFLTKSNNKVTERSVLKQPTYTKSSKYKFKDRYVVNEDYWEIEWKDLLPGDMNFNQKMVAIEESKDGKNWYSLIVDGEKMDDEGVDIEVRVEKIQKDYSIYKTKWYTPYMKKENQYRFVIYPRNEFQSVLYSNPFRLN